jgi:hypothetical protein
VCRSAFVFPRQTTGLFRNSPALPISSASTLLSQPAFKTHRPQHRVFLRPQFGPRKPSVHLSVTPNLCSTTPADRINVNPCLRYGHDSMGLLCGRMTGDPCSGIETPCSHETHGIGRTVTPRSLLYRPFTEIKAVVLVRGTHPTGCRPSSACVLRDLLRLSKDGIA